MRPTLFLVALLGLTALAVGQSYNKFHVIDGSTEYTSRGTLGTNEGEILNRVHGQHTGGLRTVKQVYFVCQDQNDISTETYELIFRKADPNGKPDITPSGILYSQGPYNISGTGTGSIVAWAVTLTLNQTLNLPDADFFVGFKVPASPSWSNDGFSIHMSGCYPAPMPCGEHARQGVKPAMAWDVAYSNGLPSVASEPSCDRVYQIELRTAGEPCLQAFAVDPAADLIPGGGCAAKKDLNDFGTAALWPDLTDLEQYGYKAKFGWRVRELNAPSGLAFVFLSGSLFALPFNTPWGGKFYLNPSDPIFSIMGGMLVSLSSGEGTTPVFDPPDAVRFALAGTDLYAQALVIDPTGPSYSLTNWFGSSF